MNSHPPRTGQQLLFLSDEDVRALIDMPCAIALMRPAFIALSEGLAHVPVRTQIPIPAHEAGALFMPAYLPDERSVGLKMVTVNGNNPSRGLPAVQALVVVADAETGRWEAIIEGEYLTALRTGAGSGLATQLLAREDATVAAIIGAGRQARTQLEAVCAVRPIERVLIFNRSRDRAEAFAAEMAARLEVEIVVAEEPERLEEADVVCTATSAREPVFDHAHLKPGGHVNGVGSYRPDMAEVPPETVRAARVVVDHREACLREAGDVIRPIRQGTIDAGHVYAELGEIAGGRVPGRSSADQITFFKSVGNAVQDLAVAAFVVREARERGVGLHLTSET